MSCLGGKGVELGELSGNLKILGDELVRFEEKLGGLSGKGVRFKKN